MKTARIVSVGSFVPPRVLTNLDLEKMVETSDEWIRTRTGIVERRITDENTSSSDLALSAAESALKKAGWKAAELDLIIVGTTSPDMFFPSTACILQGRLGATKAVCFDVSAACSGFIFALVTAQQYMIGGGYHKVLVVGVDTLSKVLNWEDRTTCVLFGDGAGAVTLEPSTTSGRGGILASDLGSDGRGRDLLKIPAGGSRQPITPAVHAQKLQYIQMEGTEIFKFAVRAVPASIKQALEKAKLKIADVDLIILHQANKRIIEAVAKKLGLSDEKFYVNIHKYGNTSAASIPLALDEALASGQARPGDNVVMSGFGAGLTWGTVAVKL